MRIAVLNAAHTAAVKALLDLCFGASAWSLDAVEGELMKPDSRCTGAFEGERLVGFLAFSQVLDEGSVVEVAVHPDFRRRGIARALIENAMEDARGLTSVFLEVRRSNAPAIALYESLGFEQIAVRRGYYDRPTEDAVVMKKKPSP